MITSVYSKLVSQNMTFYSTEGLRIVRGSRRTLPKDNVHTLSCRRPVLSLFHNSIVSMSHPLVGERTLQTLLLLSSRHRIGSPFRYSTTVNSSRSSNRPLGFRVVLNRSVCVCNSASSLLSRTRYCVRRWRTWNHKKRMSLDVSYGSNR
jgi:hypothetical protein